MANNEFPMKQICIGHLFESNYCHTSSTVLTRAKKRRKAKSDEALNRQRKAANERERKRMCSINKGFDRLRLRLPTPPYEKKLSKVDTLKQAISYIQQLSTLLHERDESTERDDQLVAPQPPTLFISSSNDPNDTGMLAVSWSRTPDKYGSAIRDERGVAYAQCAKVWVPGM